MKINEKYIQVRGKIATPDEHNLGDDIPVVVTVTSVELVDTDQEEKDVVYKCKLREIE